MIVTGKPEEKETAPTLFDAVEKARGLVLGGASVNEAAKEAAKLTGIKKSDIYKSLQSEG